MIQQRITFEWRIGEAEYDFWTDQHGGQRAAQSGVSTPNREEQLVHGLLRTLALLVIVIVAAAGLSYSPRQLQWEQAESGIRASIDRENRAWYSMDRDLFLATLDPDIDRNWANDWRRHWRGETGDRLAYTTELRHVEPLENGLVRAQVQMRQPAVEWSHVENLQEIRYYRAAPEGWVRTVPAASSDYWGERRSLRVGDLTFIYHARDEESVREAAPIVAHAIDDLYRLLDLEPPAGFEEFVIEMIPERMGRWAWEDNHIRMSSPTLSSRPAGLTQGEALAATLFNRLTYRIIHQIDLPGGRYLFRWTVMNWGLRRWMNNYLLDQPSPWHEQATPIFRSYNQDRLPLSPADISQDDESGRPTREYVIWRFLAAETLVDYGTETYGEETLPALIRAFAGASSWEEMIQHV
jgi:hypothetical protein